MALGDSITSGAASSDAGGYRTRLQQRLKAAGYRFDFVGSLKAGPTGIDRDHEGHFGWRTADLNPHIKSYLTTSKPDVVLVLTGSTDLETGTAPATAAHLLTTLLELIHQYRPTATVVLGTATPETAILPAVRRYNEHIGVVTQALLNRGYRLRKVDLFRAITTADLADGVHPADAGYAKLADAWYPTVRAVLAGH